MGTGELARAILHTPLRPSRLCSSALKTVSPGLLLPSSSTGTDPTRFVRHHYVRRAARPRDRPVLAVVGDLPHAGGGLHQRLVPVEVVLGDEVITQSHRVTEV